MSPPSPREVAVSPGAVDGQTPRPEAVTASVTWLSTLSTAMRRMHHHCMPQALATEKDQRHEPNCNELH